MAAAVRLRTKLFFWLILGTLSVFFAEVAGGSAPFPFYDAWGLYAVLPLYTLHIVFLAFAVMRPPAALPSPRCSAPAPCSGSTRLTSPR